MRVHGKGVGTVSDRTYRLTWFCRVVRSIGSIVILFEPLFSWKTTYLMFRTLSGSMSFIIISGSTVVTVCILLYVRLDIKKISCWIRGHKSNRCNGYARSYKKCFLYSARLSVLVIIFHSSVALLSVTCCRNSDACDHFILQLLSLNIVSFFISLIVSEGRVPNWWSCSIPWLASLSCRHDKDTMFLPGFYKSSVH